MTDGRKHLDTTIAEPRLWRSLDELAQTNEFRDLVTREFPDAASEWDDGTSRRSFLKLMAASLALAGLGSACTRPPRGKIVPYVRQPEDLIPGRPMYFATAYTHGGYARGILVESHEGRPTKIEGNPDHPASLGATDAIGQATILSMYDPDRSQNVTRNGDVSDWGTFINTIRAELEAKRATGGQGIRILTETITSPTLVAQLQTFLKQFPNARWHQFDPIGRANAAAGAVLAFGQNVQPVYGFVAAKAIVSLDHNFLQEDPGSLYYARKFIDGRRVRDGNTEMNRLYVAEGTPTITGAMADERLRIQPGKIEEIARAIADAVRGSAATTQLDAPSAQWVKNVVAELTAHKGAGLVLVGESQPPAVHVLGHAINAALGNIGKTVVFIDRVEAGVTEVNSSLKQLVADMNADAVDVLLMLGGNSAYSAPADFGLSEPLDRNPLSKVRLRIHLSQYQNETSFISHWHLPMTHELEAWGDARAFDGTASIVQPFIAPLYQGKSTHEVMSILLNQPDRDAYEIVREHWMDVHDNPTTFEEKWEKWLNDGVIENSVFAPKPVTFQEKAHGEKAHGGAVGVSARSTTPSFGFEILFRPDPHIWDGTYSNNGWLQELPKPLTKLTWDNAILMSSATAKTLGIVVPEDISNHRMETPLVELSIDGRTIIGPAWVMPGHADGCVTVHLGFGRTHAGKTGNGVGFNAYALRTSDRPWMADGATMRLAGGTHAMACTQGHNMMDQHGRDLLHVMPIAKLISPSTQMSEDGKRHVSLSLYPEHPYPQTPQEGNKWGMVIDQNACIGCNACVAACQAENNIPVVGKEQVARGREMHWLRIDTYFAGEAEAPDGPYFQPLPCMHCENAPCEVVCPTNATVHDAEGINNMVYNRCIGTRYCSNNCPYKVRHFNFFEYNNPKPESLKLLMNPDVTVRSRGVMEKCTYCVQRINAVRIDAKVQDRAIRDGEVITACAQACPTEAIYFGNLNDRDSSVAKLARQKQNYLLLEELQTQPRTTYLPRYTNRSSKEI